MLKSPPLVATLSDSMRMSPCSWGDIFTWPLRGDRIIGLRQAIIPLLPSYIALEYTHFSCLRRDHATVLPRPSASPRFPVRLHFPPACPGHARTSRSHTPVGARQCRQPP